jgi:formylglycine-generating enzyme required for sulfatase activity
MPNHIFISYARKDEDFVLPLAANLKRRGVPLWIDQWNIPPGVDWDQAIEDALHECAQFLIVLSPASVASRTVRGELLFALEVDKPIVPVLYRECRIPLPLRATQYADFTSGDPENEDEIGKVLSVLCVPEAPSPQPKVEGPAEPPPSKTAAPAARPKPESKEPGRPAPARAAASQKRPATLARLHPFEPEMILIPAGEFLMGSDPTKDEYAQHDEQPQHTLHLPDYYIAKTPITNAQYDAFVQATGHVSTAEKMGAWDPKAGKLGSHVKGFDWRQPEGPGTSFRERLDHPVVCVSWHDAVAYCDWLAELTGKPYRLPSEAEWEKAARGTDGRIYPWGDEWDPQRCNFGKDWEWKGVRSLFTSVVMRTTPVGHYSPSGDSPYGLLDMAGNVLEWTRSRHEDYPYDPKDGREDLDGDDFWVPLRGGAFDKAPRWVRCASRFWPTSGYRSRAIGFRVVASPDRL